MEVESFSPLRHKLSWELKRRSERYAELSCIAALLDAYPNDLQPQLVHEMELCSAVVRYCDVQDANAPEIITFLHEQGLSNVFPTVCITLRLYWAVPIASCRAERAFSTLAFIDNHLPPTMAEAKPRALAMMAAEWNAFRTLPFEGTIAEFCGT